MGKGYVLCVCVFSDQVIQESCILICRKWIKDDIEKRKLNFKHILYIWRASFVAQMVKNMPAMQEAQVQSLGWEDFLEKEMETHFSILACRIPQTEESGGLQSMESQRVRHDWVTNTSPGLCISGHLVASCRHMQTHSYTLGPSIVASTYYMLCKYFASELIRCYFFFDILYSHPV